MSFVIELSMEDLINQMVEKRLKEKEKERFQASSTDVQALIKALLEGKEQHPNALPKTAPIGMI